MGHKVDMVTRPLVSHCHAMLAKPDDRGVDGGSVLRGRERTEGGREGEEVEVASDARRIGGCGGQRSGERVAE